MYFNSSIIVSAPPQTIGHWIPEVGDPCIILFAKQSWTHKNGYNSLGGDGLVAKSRPTLVTLWIVAHQTLLLMGFPRQDYRSGLPFSSPGDFANSGVELTSPALQLDTLLLSYQGTRLHHLALSCFNLLTIQLILDLSPKFQCSCSYGTNPVAL